MTLKLSPLWLSVVLLLAGRVAPGQEVAPEVRPPGEAKSAKTSALAVGARALQKSAPPAQLDIYLVGFHPMKDHPERQLEAHHFCRQVNQDFAQCVLFDGNTAEANLNGVEYIISERMFEQLPPGERKYWHPHNYEILSGQLIGPGLPQAAEHELIQTKVNSYGKTWHVWNTGHFGLEDADRLPLGEAQLAWSFNREGEARPGLVERMEKQFDVDVSEKRETRRDLVRLAKPQEGVDALEGKFGRPTRLIEGVQRKGVAER